MQQYAKMLDYAIMGAVGVVAGGLLTFAIVQFAVPRAEATPALAGGKPCNTCHTSASPNKGDVKK
jgi:hypothetical protein